MKNIFKFLTIGLLINITLLANNIKIIDPKVTINQGKANSLLKIKTPKGINSITPSLAIQYTSQEGNGLAGLDTTIKGISKIIRCGEKPVFNQYDNFCLDEEPLVRVESDNNDSNKIKYLLFNNPSVKFVKANDIWTMYKANGDVVTFGENDTSKIKISYKSKYYDNYDRNYKNESNTNTIIWNINNKVDKNNNKIEYKYNKINGIPYINEISYEHNKIKFDYESRIDNYEIDIDYPKGLTLINENTYNYKLKIEYPSTYVNITKRLNKISIYENKNISYNYDLNYIYEDASNVQDEKSLLDTLTYCLNDGTCLDPVKFSYATYLDTSDKIVNNKQNNLQEIYLLDKVTNNFGVSKEIKYSFTDNNDILNDDNIYNVSSLNIEMPDDGFKTLEYEYLDHKYIDEKHNYSFVTIKDSLTNIVTTTSYSQEEHSLNKPLKEIKKINDVLISDTIFDYKVITEVNSKQERVLLSSRQIKKYDLKGTYLSTTIVDYTYDEFDNIVNETSTIKGDSETYTVTKEITYLKDEKNHIINKPTKITSSSKLDNQAKKTLITSFNYDNKGNLISKTIAKDTQEELTTTYEYNNKGLLDSTNIGDRTTSLKYDSINRIVEKTDALGYKTKFFYKNDICINKPTSISNINDQSTSYEYNAVCEVVKTIEPNGRTTEVFYDNEAEQIDLGIDYQNIGFDSLIGLKSIYSITKRTNTGLWDKKYFNRFGKVIRVVKIGDDDRKIYKDIIYNKKGLKKAVSLPYFKGKIMDKVNYTQYKYDELNRITQSIKPKENVQIITKYNYDGLKTTITKANNSKRMIRKNILDKEVKIEEENSVILYKYDSLLNLIQTNTNGKIIDVKYDILNRKISLDDPSIGLIKYEYNKFNNLIKQTNNTICVWIVCSTTYCSYIS